MIFGERSPLTLALKLHGRDRPRFSGSPARMPDPRDCAETPRQFDARAMSSSRECLRATEAFAITRRVATGDPQSWRSGSIARQSFDAPVEPSRTSGPPAPSTDLPSEPVAARHTPKAAEAVPSVQNGGREMTASRRRVRSVCISVAHAGCAGRTAARHSPRPIEANPAFRPRTRRITSSSRCDHAAGHQRSYRREPC